MKATWVKQEYPELIELIKTSILNTEFYLDNLNNRLEQENSDIDKLVWYKRLFKTKHDKKDTLLYATDLVIKIHFASIDLTALNRILKRVNQICSSSNLLLNQDELDLIFGYK